MSTLKRTHRAMLYCSILVLITRSLEREKIRNERKEFSGARIADNVRQSSFGRFDDCVFARPALDRESVADTESNRSADTANFPGTQMYIPIAHIPITPSISPYSE